MTTLPSAHIYLSDTSISCFHLYSECVQFQTMIYILIIRKWSRYHLCIFAKLTPVHTTDVKDFARSTEIIRKKHQISKFLKDYIRLLRLFLYIYSISLVVKPIGLPRDNRTLRSKPISQFFSVVTVRSLSGLSLRGRGIRFYIFQTLQIDSAWESLLLCYC